jgi:prepilin peptidase CpaA
VTWLDPRLALVVGIGLTAAIWDVKTRRIPNVVTLGAAAAGLVYAIVEGGGSGAAWSLAGWTVGLVAFLPLFALGGLGGGDVKLLAAFGTWLGPVGALWAALAAALVGGAGALAIGTVSGYIGQALRNVLGALHFWAAFGPRPVPGLTLDDAPGPRLAYAIPIAIGALVSFWLTEA